MWCASVVKQPSNGVDMYELSTGGPCIWWNVGGSWQTLGMGFLEDMSDTISRLDVFAELNVPAAELPKSALGLSDASVRDALAVVAGLGRQVATLQSVLAGVAAARSGRDRGHGGLVQGTGHRNTFEFIRDLTGSSRGEAVRTVKVGEALLEGHGDGAGGPVPDAGAVAGEDVPPPVPPWHEPLNVAVLKGTLTSAQHDAICVLRIRSSLMHLHRSFQNNIIISRCSLLGKHFFPPFIYFRYF